MISVCLMCEHRFHISGLVQRTRKAVSDEQTGDSTRSAKRAKKLEVRVYVLGGEGYPAFCQHASSLLTLCQSH